MRYALWLKSVNGTNNACDSNVHEAKVSNVLAKERATKVHHESDEKNEVRVGKKAGDWTQPAKHVPINCFFENTQQQSRA